VNRAAGKGAATLRAVPSTDVTTASLACSFKLARYNAGRQQLTGSRSRHAKRRREVQIAKASREPRKQLLDDLLDIDHASA
jgi:hypothetical protein